MGWRGGGTSVTISEYERRRKASVKYREILVLASLGLLGTVGPATSVDFFDSPDAKACMAAVADQDLVAIESFLIDSPQSPLIPAMLMALRPEVLSEIRPGLVAALPQEQKDRLSLPVLLQFGLVAPETLAPPAPPVPPVSAPKTKSPY